MLCVTRRNSSRSGPTSTRLARRDRNQTSLGVDPVFVELRLNERERERRAVDRAVDVRDDVRDGADVILVPVREHERADPAAVGASAPTSGMIEIDAEELGPREHHAGIDEQSGIPAGDEQHVHAELANPAERDDVDRRRSNGARSTRQPES